MNVVIPIAIAALLLAPEVAPAQGHSGAASQQGAQAAAAGADVSAFTDAEVRKVDRDAQKLTLRHGPIPNLGMGNMTMVFRVTDPKMLDGVKQGDKVRFKADKVGGQYTVTALEPAR